jgi:hypothetical protein
MMTVPSGTRDVRKDGGDWMRCIDGEDKEVVLHLDRGEHAQLAAAAASAGVGVLDCARDATLMAVQEDQALGVLAEALERYGRPSVSTRPLTPRG